MACELPVIARPAGGISNSVADGESGYLFKPADIEGYLKD
jgi:glycosyltransferase involved in cell wall biosynthesis